MKQDSFTAVYHREREKKNKIKGKDIYIALNTLRISILFLLFIHLILKHSDNKGVWITILFISVYKPQYMHKVYNNSHIKILDMRT